MNSSDLLTLLGRRLTDPAVEATLAQHAVRARPEVEIDRDDPEGPVVQTQDWVKNSRAGIEFGFQDEAAWLGLDETEFGTRPMVLIEICFFGRHPGVRPYQGALPFGLQLSDDRETVRYRMHPYESTRHSYTRDTWDTAGARVTVHYAGGGAEVGFVLCMLREPPLPPLPYALPPPPTIDALIDLLGEPLGSPGVHAALDPLGLLDRIEQIADTGLADFCYPYGVSVEFASIDDTARRRDASDWLVLSVTLYRERELDARAWTGGLPYGLTFDDSPEDAVRRVGRAPDAQHDDDFTGIAEWREPAYTLRVLYTTMENRLLRVTLVAPGLPTGAS